MFCKFYWILFLKCITRYIWNDKFVTNLSPHEVPTSTLAKNFALRKFTEYICTSCQIYTYLPSTNIVIARVNKFEILLGQYNTCKSKSTNTCILYNVESTFYNLHKKKYIQFYHFPTSCIKTFCRITKINCNLLTTLPSTFNLTCTRADKCFLCIPCNEPQYFQRREQNNVVVPIMLSRIYFLSFVFTVSDVTCVRYQ